MLTSSDDEIFYLWKRTAEGNARTDQAVLFIFSFISRQAVIYWKFQVVYTRPMVWPLWTKTIQKNSIFAFFFFFQNFFSSTYAFVTDYFSSLSNKICISPLVAQARSKYHRHCYMTFNIQRVVWKMIKMWKDLNKNRLTLLKFCVSFFLC